MRRSPGWIIVISISWQKMGYFDKKTAKKKKLI